MNICKIKISRKIILVNLLILIMLIYQAPLHVNALNTQGKTPKFIVHDITNLDMIQKISKFRSTEGHDYSDSFEIERSMKQHYCPFPKYIGYINKVPIYSPVYGEIVRIEKELTPNSGFQVRIRVKDHKDFIVILFHVNIFKNITAGLKVYPGQMIGYVHLLYPCFDVAILRILYNNKIKYYSIFEVMDDKVFEKYKAKGIFSRDIMVKSRKEADYSPFNFYFPDPDDMVFLHHGKMNEYHYCNRETKLTSYLYLQEEGSWDNNIGLAVGSFIKDNILYVASKAGGLTIINISDPRNPKILGQFFDGGVALDVFVKGRYAYVADGPDGLEIIDVSDPLHPVKVGNFSLDSYAISVFVKNEYAYIAYYSNGLVIVDVSRPSHPRLIGQYFDEGLVFSVYVKDNLAYVADGWKNLEIINVSDPRHPKKIGVSRPFALARKVIVKDSYAYVANDWGGLEIFDVSNPLNPILVSRIARAYRGFARRSQTYDIYIKDNIIFLADIWMGIHLVDISDPRNPRYITTYPGKVYSINGDNNYIISINDFGIIEILNIKNVKYPIRIASIRFNGYSMKVYIDGSYAYLANGFGGLKIIDISDPYNPREVGEYNFPRYNLLSDIFKNGNLIFLSTFYDGIYILDVRNPQSPKFINRVTLKSRDQRYYGIFVSGNYLYIAGYSRGLEIVDLKRRKTGSFFDGGVALDVFVKGRYAYVADGPDGLEIIDVSDPLHPVKVGNFYDGGYAFDVMVLDNKAYVADGWGGFEIIDVKDPRNPVKIGEYRTKGIARSVYINDTYAYVTLGMKGMEVINISDPENPNLIGWYRDGEDIRAVYVRGSHIFVSEGWGGLKILSEKVSSLPVLRVNSSPPTIVYLNGSKQCFTPCNIKVIPAVYNVTLIYNNTEVFKKIIEVSKNYSLNIYKITVSSRYGIVKGEGWFEKDSLVTVKLVNFMKENKTIYIKLAPNVRAVFRGWKFNQKFSNSTDLKLKINSSLFIEAIWIKEYYVNVTSDYGEIKGGGWIREGETSFIYVNPPIYYEKNNIRHIFKGWNINIKSNNTFNNNIIKIKVEKPLKIKAIWDTQYLINISYHGNIYIKWVKKDTTFTVPNEIPRQTTGLIRYILVGFKDKNGVEYGLIFRVEKPLTLKAVYKPDYTFLILLIILSFFVIITIIYTVKRIYNSTL